MVGDFCKAQAISMEDMWFSSCNNFHVRRAMLGLCGELELHISPIKKCLGVEVLR